MLYSNRQYFDGYITGVNAGKTNQSDNFNEMKNTRWADTIEITYFLSGKDMLCTGDRVIINTPDTVRISPPINVHDGDARCRNLEPSEYIDIHFRVSRSFVTETTMIDVSSNTNIRELFIKLNTIWRLKQKCYYFKAMPIFYQIMDELFNATVYDVQKDDNLNKIDLAVKYIHMHYFEKEFKISSLPALCGMKHAYFNRLFAKRFNTTPIKYITSLRMKLAVDLIMDKKLSIAEIAEKTGYESARYFTNVFKKTIGVPPTKYTLHKKINTIYN